MPSQVQIGLSFTADTSKARQEIEKLKNDLNKIMTNTSFGKGNNDIVNQTAKLSGILTEATKETGKLDLTKFQKGLSKANIDLNAMAREFQKIDGGNFFNELATQVMNADTRVTILSGKLKKFADGLMNTAMWTIQSNAIHAVQSALQSAYSYAQQLNKGLTDIAIVSDLNTQQLTDFAKTANQMAKDLSANTKDVVSGALIYYQAGLSEEEVIKRTETTIKLAQTSGESAEQISSYMTAIWNNFYDGSQSVEYYADVISYLGAVTAASNADIAEGMQSFSAVAQTVGLDFEDAAAAMTLLRDITQQSASTIGNSLKTIFARLSSLKMGETLEDGTDLTKYTAALETVGVQVKDANGELRDMSDIIRDLAEHWDSLDRAQKDALAQTVGGVRQYNNLITLMDHFEEFEDLVAGSRESTGYLQDQADIYAKSWEAAKNRLTAAWQGIYDQIIDDKFFIKLTNFLTGIVNFISEIIKGAGGIPGILSAIGMAITAINPEGIAQSLRDVKDTILLIKDTLNGTQVLRNIDQITEVLNATLGANLDTSNNQIIAYYDIVKNKIQEITQLRANGQDKEAAEMMSQVQRYMALLDTLTQVDARVQRLRSSMFDLAAAANQPESFLTESFKNVDAMTRAMVAKNNVNSKQDAINLQQLWKNAGISDEDVMMERLTDLINSSASKKKWAKKLEQAKNGFIEDAQKIATEIQQELQKAFTAEGGGDPEAFLNILNKHTTKDAIEGIEQEVARLIRTTDDGGESARAFIAQISEITKEEAKYADFNKQLQQIANNLDNLSGKNQQINRDWANTANSVLRAASAITSIASGINGFIDSAKEGNITLGSLVGTLSSITMGVLSLQGAIKANQALAEAISAKGGIISATFLGPWGLLIIPIIMLAIKGITVGIQWLQDNFTLDGKLQKANDALAEQEQQVQNLRNEYEQLSSTIQSLTSDFEELQNLTPGSAEYLLKLNLYEAKLQELRDKYGDGIFTKDATTGLPTIDEDKLNNAVLTQLYGAEYVKTLRQQDVNNGNTEKALRDITNRADLDYTGDGYMIPDNNGNEVYIGASNYEAIVSTVKENLENGDTWNNGLDNLVDENGNAIWTDLNETIKNYVYGKIVAYEQAIAAQSTTPALDSMNGILSSTGLLSAIGDNDAVNAAVQDLIDAKVTAIGEDPSLLEEAKDFYKRTNNIDLTETLTDEQVQEAINSYAAGLVGASLVGLNAYEQANALQLPQTTIEAREKALQEAVEQQDYEGYLQKKYAEATEKHGLDEDSVENLTNLLASQANQIDDLADSMQNDSLAAMELADDILRFDEAVVSVKENYDDWMDALNSGNLEDKAKAMAEMQEAYGNLLDIDGSELSANFLEDAKNLERMKEAIAGDEEAYQELLDLANQDLNAKFNIDTSQVENAKNLLDEFANSVYGRDWDDIEIGTFIDSGPAIDAMNDIINAADMTAQQATDYLATMGVDAVVKQVEVPEKQQYTDATPIIEPETFTGFNPLNPLQPTTYSFPRVRYDLKPADTTNIKTTTALQVVSARKSAGGNFKFDHSTQGGGGGGKKSGGGGGSKQKTKEKDTTRYHEITSRIEQNQHALNMLNAAEDRAYGQKKLDMMDQKLKLLEQQAELYKELAKEAQAYYDSDRDRLHNEYGAAFNADGTIKDYDAWYGSFVDKYNAGQMSDDEWKKFEDAIKKYEESLKKLNEAEEKTQKNLFEQYDLKLEKVEYKLKTITDLIEMDMKYLNYMINMLDDDGLDTAEAMAYIAKEIDDTTKKYQANKEALAGIFKNHEGVTDDIIADLYSGKMSVNDFIAAIGDFTQKEIDSIQSIMSDMFSNGEELKKYLESLYDKLNELSDKFQEALNKQIDKLNHMNNMIEKTRNIIDVMGKDTLGISDELLNRMQRAQIEIGKEHIATLQQELDQYRLWLAQEQALYDTMDPNSMEAKELAKVIENYKKTISDLEEEILDSAADTAERIKQIYTDMIEQTVKAAGDIVSGAVGDFDKLMDVYEKQKNLNDRYLDTYEKTYQTNKLLMDINKALDNTDNIGTQEKLRDLQAEILGYQKDGLEVTEQQMEERRLYYELLLAEAALQEAQDAKSQVRMTRDSEGNWSYTYTADQGKVDDLRQKYNDALHAYEEFNEQTLQTMQDTLLQLQQEYSEALATAQTEDEVRAAQEYFEPMIEHQREMIDYFITRNNELVNNFDVGADQVSTTLGDTVYGMVTGFGTMDEAAQTMDEAYQQAAEDVVDYLKDMEQEQQNLAGIVGVTEPQINTDLDEIEKGVKDVNTEVDKISEEFDDEFGAAMGELEEFHNKLGPIVESICGEIGKITDKVGSVITAYSKLNATPINTPDLSGPIGAFRALEAAANAAAAAAKAAASAGSTTPGVQDGSYKGSGGQGSQTTVISHKTGYMVNDDGGLMNSWGPEGKFAMMHEKELVLNKHDTENMLKTVGFVRDLTQMISMNANIAGNGLGNLILGGVSQGGGFLDQNVTIHAEFPNATNHAEIEEAFSNLIGLATQYAGRKK